MIRLATPADAWQLFCLNAQFNGEDETTPEALEASLSGNGGEIVVVAEEGARLAGFVCVHLKKSFCYLLPSAEITEVFVLPEFRRRGLAREMISFAEAHCTGLGPVRCFEILTGRDNVAAQALYASLGYAPEDELLLVKQVV